MRSRFGRSFLAVLVTGALALAIAGGLAAAGAADGDDEAGRTWFTALLETMLSTPDREVRIAGLDGVFSANPKIGRVTVADGAGVWLELDDVEMAWNRSALFDRRIEVERLSAARVAMLRKPQPGAQSASGGGASLPPLAIDLKAVSLPRIVLAASVAAGAAELTATGSARISADAVAATLAVERQDRAGSLALDLRLEPQANVLTADLTLEEPAGGLMAELLDLRGRPAVAVALSGTGPLDDWHGQVEMRAGADPVLAGALAVTRTEDAYGIAADLSGALAGVAPERYAGLFAGRSRLVLDATRGDGGTITVRSATLRSDGIDLAAHGVLAPGLVPQSAALSLTLGRAGRTALPFAPGGLSVASLSIDAGLDAGEAAPWRAQIDAKGIEAAFGTAESVALAASGEARGLADPAARAVSFRFDASAAGIAAADAKIRAALGPMLKASGTGSWSAGNPITFDEANAVLAGAAANFAGTATGEALAGEFSASVVDLARFSALAGRALKGGAEIKASGSAGLGGALDLTLDGTTSGLALGIAGLDPLLAGATKLSGGVARNDEAIRFTDLALVNDAVSASLNGSLAEPAIDMTVKASVADLSLVSERAAGAAEISARIGGTRAAPQVDAEATGERLLLMERPLNDARASFSGIVSGPTTSGSAELTGLFGDAPVRGSATLSSAEGGARAIKGLRLAVGESRMSGDLTLGADGLLSGDLSIVSPDLSKVAPLFLVDASGMLRADVALRGEDGAQTADVSAVATDIAAAGVTLRSAEIKGSARDLLRAPLVEGTFSLRELKAGGLDVVSASGTAQRSGGATAFSLDARLADGSAQLAGDLAPATGGIAIGLQRFTFKRTGIDVALAAPTTIAVADGTARFDRTTLKAGSGSVVVTGTAGSALDVQATLNALPAALVNAFVPTLGAEGTVSGIVAARGSASDPQATFDITLAGASVAASRNAGLGALGVTARGALADRRVDLTSQVFGADGMSVQVSGTVGTASGAPLDLRIAGSVPLALGNNQLAARGAALKGALDVDIAVSGSTSAPRYAGRITSSGGGFVDPATGIVLRDLALAASVRGMEVVVERLEAKSGDGTVSASGTVGLDPGAGFPIDLALKVHQARYVDGTLIAARFDAELAMTGKLADGPVVKGSVTLDRTEITVPDRLPHDSVAVDVRHVGAPPRVEKTLAAAHGRDARKGSAPPPKASGILLDVVVNAPQQIFVRGRGLDAEFGGDLRLFGPASALTASGAFQMVRGRLDILTQRIAFDRGTITFAGDLDPILDFSGSTRSSDVTITVTVSGRASDPQVTFSSVPELPQDEILAQLIFNKAIGELSPLQVARLAAAASELSGGSGGILSRLRASTGLDDLDIVTDEEGQTAVAAGRYVTENVYVGVQQGTDAGSSRVTIDLDVTKSVKARAGVSAGGESSLGIFFEREY